MINKFLAEWPSTNGRIFATMFAFMATVGTVLYCIVAEINLDPYEWVIAMLFTAEAAFAGLDVAQFKFKRDSHMESPPSRPDVEDAKALQKPPADAAVG